MQRGIELVTLETHLKHKPAVETQESGNEFSTEVLSVAANTDLR